MFTNYNLKLYLSFILFAISIAALTRAFTLSYLPDFTGYYYGAQHIFHYENPYIPDKNYFTSQSYPPFTLILFIPLSFFSLEIASKIWIAFSITTILCIIHLFTKMHKVSFFSPTNLFFSSLVMLSFPLKFTLGMGQINIVVLLFLTLFFYFFSKKNNTYSGLFLAFPLMIKFFPLLLVPYLFLRKKWKMIATLLITLLALFGLTYLFTSPAVVQIYFQHTLPELLSSWKGEYYNQSLAGFLMRAMQDSPLRNMLRVSISFIFLLALAWPVVVKKTKNIERIKLEVSAVITLSLLINSFSWQHHFILLLIPFFVTYFYLKNKKLNKYYLIILSLSYLLVAVNLKNPYSMPVIFQSHVFYGALILYGLQIYLLFKNK